MADATSPTTGRCYGVARVCQVWDVPRSSFYAARQTNAAEAGPRPSPARRGPQPAISDEDLLAAIRADLARSPWTGEGHRKVWARLRAMDGIRVSRKRALRLMRGESAELLSRELGLPIVKLEQWRQKAEVALEGALKERESDPAESQLAAAMQRIGELSMENELLRARIGSSGPLGRRRSR